MEKGVAPTGVVACTPYRRGTLIGIKNVKYLVIKELVLPKGGTDCSRA